MVAMLNVLVLVLRAGRVKMEIPQRPSLFLLLLPPGCLLQGCIFAVSPCPPLNRTALKCIVDEGGEQMELTASFLLIPYSQAISQQGSPKKKTRRLY